MNPRLALLQASVFLACATCHAQIPGLAESHIGANVPSTNDFRPFLIRDLTAYLKPTHGDKLTVDYQLLRDGPTQSGVAYPKFYLWLKASNAEKAVIEGAVRVAAIEKKRFDVTDFVPRTDVVSHPDALDRIFPQAVIEKIHTILAGDFGGIGLVILDRRGANEPLRTGTVYPGSPADHAGVTTNGFLISVDGTNVVSMSLTQAVSVVRGPVGTFVKVEIADPKMSATNTFTAKRSRMIFSNKKIEFTDQ